jgi:predicted GNAT family N-acyltransferase
MQNEHELMWTALDDIARMYKDHPCSVIAKRTLDQVEKKYGR